MKKVIESKTIFAFIIGGLIFGIIGVSAKSYMYYSDQVIYKNDKNEEIDVNSAIDDLYQMTSNKKNTVNMINLTAINATNGLSTYNLKENAALYGIDSNLYSTLTSANFIVEFNNISASMGVSTGGEGTAWVSTTQSASGTLQKNYSNTTGVFTSSNSCSSSRRNWVNDGTVSVSASTSNYKVYLIY